MQEVTWFSVLISIAQTAIGAGLGFGLGWIAFRMQHNHQMQTAKSNAESAMIDALNRVHQAAAINIETLAMIKVGVTKELSAEVDTMKRHIQEFRSASQDEVQRAWDELKEASTELNVFYKVCLPISVMPTPEFREFSSVLLLMPALSTYVHRAMEGMSDINHIVRDRNRMIRDLAHSGGKEARDSFYLYSTTMLVGQGDALADNVDNTMGFFSMVMEQIELYMKGTGKEAAFISTPLLPAVAEELPVGDLFPVLREQMVKFD